ncbi:MAG: YeaH/YhbH family protein [Candidatus Parcubacteria bacterium]|nr:YeaH/YhbH family protein [Candidatus Parcubacteria bacterium]
MSNIVDKRSLPGQSTINRDRFKKRYDEVIKKAVEDSFKTGDVTDKKGGGMDIPIKGTNEPRPRHSPGGINKRVFPGNKKGDDGFIKGDRIARPSGGAGGSGKKAGQGEDSEDDFMFHIDQKEFLDYVFADMELPNLVKRHLAKDAEQLQRVNAGISTVGPPPRLSIPRTYQQAYPRQRIFKRKEKIQMIKDLSKELEELLLVPEENRDTHRIEEIERFIEKLRRKLKAIPFFDPSLDLRYHTSKFEPTPVAQAVLFFLMDVSGSMDENLKDLAKRFFFLLYLFIHRNYERVRVVFIRHTTEAQEVTEKEFFYDKLTGGTLVSTALELTDEIIEKRYNPSEWNIYVAQASDGDNWMQDTDKCHKLLDKILSLAQYFAFIQTVSVGYPERTELWKMYRTVYDSHKFDGTFEMRTVRARSDIFPVFRELFKKKGVIKNE